MGIVGEWESVRWGDGEREMGRWGEGENGRVVMSFDR